MVTDRSQTRSRGPINDHGNDHGLETRRDRFVNMLVRALETITATITAQGESVTFSGAPLGAPTWTAHGKCESNLPKEPA